MTLKHLNAELPIVNVSIETIDSKPAQPATAFAQ